MGLVGLIRILWGVYGRYMAKIAHKPCSFPIRHYPRIHHPKPPQSPHRAIQPYSITFRPPAFQPRRARTFPSPVPPTHRPPCNPHAAFTTLDIILPIPYNPHHIQYHQHARNPKCTRNSPLATGFAPARSAGTNKKHSAPPKKKN